MAKKKYTAIHRIMTKAKPLTYVEPGTSFMMEESEGEKLVKLGAVKITAEEAKAPAKKTTTAKKPAQYTAGDGESDDLV